MARTIYLIVYNSPLFPAHWSFWIPSKSDETVGKRLQATGDALNGFTVAFERNYDLESESRAYRLVALGQVDDIHVADGNCSKGGPESTDATATDKLEEIALSVPAPGPSLVSSSSVAPKRRADIKNCQTWLQDVVEKLVEHNVMEQGALAVVAKAPRN